MFEILANSLWTATRQDHAMLRDVIPEAKQKPTRHTFWRRQGWRDINIKNL